MDQPLHRRRRRRPDGFTLVELLVVLGIIALLSALVLPAVTSLNKSAALNASGRLFIGLLSTARSEAITRRTVVRLEVATTWPDPAYSYRKLTLTAATLSPDGTAYTYRQIGKWETLDNGIVLEVHDPMPGAPADGSVYLLNAGGNTPLGDTGSLTFGGQAVPTAYVAFSSTGGLIEQQPPAGLPVSIRARVVEGTVGAANVVTYTHRTGGATAANWLDVRINNLVGRVEVGRPESPLL